MKKNLWAVRSFGAIKLSSDNRDRIRSPRGREVPLHLLVPGARRGLLALIAFHVSAVCILCSVLVLCVVGLDSLWAIAALLSGMLISVASSWATAMLWPSSKPFSQRRNS